MRWHKEHSPDNVDQEEGWGGHGRGEVQSCAAGAVATAQNRAWGDAPIPKRKHPPSTLVGLFVK